MLAANSLLYALKRSPYFPILALLCGVCLSIATLFFLVQPVAKIIGSMMLILAIGALLRQRFFLMGLSAGIAAMSFNIDLPYRQTFSDCRYQAVIQHADYSRQYRGGITQLAATDIVCTTDNLAANPNTHLAANSPPNTAPQTIHLPNQTVQFWDYNKQLRHLLNKQLTVRSQLHPIHSRQNPFSFDYERHLLSQGIRLAAKQVHIEQTTAAKPGLPLLRHRFSQIIIDNLSPNQAAIILALVTGNRSQLSAEQKSMMQQTGTSHILAISGLHLALVGGLAWVIFQGLWACSWRLSNKVSPIKAGAIAALVTISGYALLTGFNLPVQRAWLMFSLLIIAWLWLRSVTAHSLLLAAVIVLLTNPYALLFVGFYYSFIATYVVLWCVQLNYSPLVKILLMQLLINLALLPITWWAFGMISLSAFWVNLLIIPWLGLWVLPWAMLACCLTLLSPTLTQPLWELVELSTTAMWQVIVFFQSLPLTLTPGFRPPLVAVIIAVLSVLLALLLRKGHALFGLLILSLPLSLSTAPAIIIADSRYTNVLVHNGKDAIIINPGYHYRQRNDADKWQRYLQRHNLQLAAILLQNNKLSQISATASLLRENPNTSVISLAPMDLPYPQQYCQALRLPNLQLSVTNSTHCQATLHWFGQQIILFPDNDLAAKLAAKSDKNALLNASQFIWQSTHYNAQQLGAVSIEKAANSWQITYQRQTPKLWRIHQPIPNN